VQIVAFSNDGIQGVPSEPFAIYANGFLPVGPLDDVTGVSITPTSFVDSNGSHWVNLNPVYKAPAILGRFYGVSLHGVGYLGSTDLQEFGNILTYTKNTGGQPRRFTMPMMASDEDLWHGGLAGVGVVHAINGSPTVTRVSGSNFIVTGIWNNKKLYGPALSLIGTISVVGSINSITLTSNFTGTTGDYVATVLNPMTFYFVSVDREGRRRVDPLSAPSVVVPQGIFAY
jgi:hypothetical protein